MIVVLVFPVTECAAIENCTSIFIVVFGGIFSLGPSLMSGVPFDVGSLLAIAV